jgi:hypothetical protein
MGIFFVAPRICEVGLSIPVRDYLGSVLPGLADFPINRVAELTPKSGGAVNRAAGLTLTWTFIF